MGEAVKICGREKFERVLQQLKAPDSGVRSNCQERTVGGRKGYELILLDGYSFDEESSYRLFWEPFGRESDERSELRLSFKMNSPLRGKKDGDIVQPPDEVIGRWRAMLGTVRFFEPVALDGDKPYDGPADETAADLDDEPI
ncbi:hypothetical protein LJB99_02595 [Deltaproteobacteria bacterium OttesenSCG-928-K17]|nr:hypothetical protein [Deltaproteobacteria bacterium OttesenSCG-928-K17]